MAYPITSQPAKFQAQKPASNEWSSGMCNCCDDMGTCLCGAFVPCILSGKVATAYGECVCLPALCGTSLALRTGMRERYHIKGSICDDFIKVTFCSQCTLCQMYREIKARK